MLPGKLVSLLLGLVFGGLLLALPPMKVFMIVVGLGVALTLIRKPLWGLLIFAVLATSIPYTTLQLGIRTTISEAVLGLTWAGVFWQSFIGKTRGFMVWRPTERALMWLMLFSTIPFIWGMIIIHAEGNGPVNWVRWLMNLSLLFIVPLLLRTDADRDKVVVALLLGNLAMLLLSIFMFLKTRNAMSMIDILTDLKYAHPEAVKDIFSANYKRMASPWVHPNLTGGVLVLFIPIWLTYKRVPHSGRIIGIGAAFVIALVLFYPPLQDRLMTMFSTTNASTEIRFDEYAGFPDVMAKYPLGIGFKIDPPVPGSNLLGISNLWLNFIYKIGIPGMLLFIAVTVLWWREVRPLGMVRKVTADNALWLGCVCGVLAALLTGIFDHYFSFTFVLIALFWLLMGISLQQVRLSPTITAPVSVPKDDRP